METIERHKHVSRTLVCISHKRFKDGWSGNPMEEVRGRLTKRDEKLKNQVMDVILDFAFFPALKKSFVRKEILRG